MKHRVKNASKILNLYVDAGKCLKYSPLKSNFAAEVDKTTEEVLAVVKKMTAQKSLKQLNERVKHLKQVIKL